MAEPRGARVPADPERLAEAEGWWRQYIASSSRLRHLAVLLAEYDRRGAEVERLRQDLARLDWAGMLTEQTCRAGKHVTWYVDDEGAVACPWCRRDEARAEVERLAAQRATALAAVDGLESDSAAFSTVPGFRRYVVDGIREALGAAS